MDNIVFVRDVYIICMYNIIQRADDFLQHFNISGAYHTP